MMAVGAKAQELKSDYVNWGLASEQFGEVLTSWAPGQKISEDDNFFISRVKPRTHFRNQKTQVRLGLDATNDKRLVAWLPVNEPGKNGLPDGVYDSEVFSMWNYVTHWGNWTAPLGRVPGAFLDVAHKNGVPVTSVASVPYGAILGGWTTCFNKLSAVAPEKAAQFLNFYGVNGLGYNSEFSTTKNLVEGLQKFHEGLVEKASVKDPLFENLWYDGTSDVGFIHFDGGLGAHNDGNFGSNGKARSSLFLNYNWNSTSLLQQSVDYAKTINRDPLLLYAGINMQGGEPKSGPRWTLLKDYPISIGLWGAHQRSMFWESRQEKGSAPEVQQRTYMLRTERWFTGGTRNPINCPEINNSLAYHADNFDFHGMSSMMSARSSLKWDLSEEPFISYFNLGNGKFMNWNGERANSLEWYNIGVQDYLPTWRWWFAKELLGREKTNVPAQSLDAEFIWDDAYVGGSCLRVFGSGEEQYLHLFKTDYALQSGDVITFRYKLVKGSADLNLALTTVGAEETAVAPNDFKVFDSKLIADEDVWLTKTFTVGESLAGKNLALVALHFENAKDMNLRIGEFSIVRGVAQKPATPVVESSKLLYFSRKGVDGKLIFNMPNDKPAGEVCYNLDVKTSMFKLYVQQENKEPLFVGLTTSWAGMFYNAPLVLDEPSARVRFGVSALSLDHKAESEIAWGEYLSTSTYDYNDDIRLDKTSIKPGEDFEMSFVDPLHESGKWELLDKAGKVVFTGEGRSVKVESLTEIGAYKLRLTAPQYDKDKKLRPVTTREFGGFVQITSKEVGALPKILTLTANEKNEAVEVKVNEKVAFAYTGREADGAGSQGVDLKEERFGVKAADLDLTGGKSFSVAFWLKINKLATGETQLFSVANKGESWPKTDWGWIWCNLQEDGRMGSFTFRGTDRSANEELRYKFEETRLPIGNWVHIAYSFDYNEDGKFRADYYVDGVKQKLTGWNRRSQGDTYQNTDPGYQPNVYNITKGQVIAVGGKAAFRNGIDGVIDNLVVWDKAITADEVALSMGDLDPAKLPENVLGLWNLEEKAGENNVFPAVGKKVGVEAGTHNFEATGNEGQGVLKWIASSYTSGTPFVKGTAFPVVTKAVWKAKKSEITGETGNATAGEALIAFKQKGDYDVTLTLVNSLGSDSKKFSVIKVDYPESIGTVEAADFRTIVVGEDVLIEFAQAGRYDVSVYNLAGQRVAHKDARIFEGGNVQLRLGQTGTYVVKVARDGKVVRTVKLLKK